MTGTIGGNGRTPGLVMLGELETPVSGADFAARIKALGPSGYLRSMSGTEDRPKPS